MKLEQFCSKENSEREKPHIRRKTDDDAYSVRTATIKIGICIALCVGLCIVNMISESNNSYFASENDEDSPGKLRFVELPGIIEVFAGGDKLTVPIGDYESAEWDENDNVLIIKASSNATVVTCSSGTVKEIGKDSNYGNYVAIRHGDIEAYYYGLSYITVEERQVINKLDTLGLLSQSGIMHLKIYENGIPSNPCDFLPIDIHN